MYAIRSYYETDFIKVPNMALHEKVLFGAFIFGIIGLFTFIGVVTPGMGWFLYFFLIPNPNSNQTLRSWVEMKQDLYYIIFIITTFNILSGKKFRNIKK